MAGTLQDAPSNILRLHRPDGIALPSEASSPPPEPAPAAAEPPATVVAPAGAPASNAAHQRRTMLFAGGSVVGLVACGLVLTTVVPHLRMARAPAVPSEVGQTAVEAVVSVPVQPVQPPAARDEFTDNARAQRLLAFKVLTPQPTPPAPLPTPAPAAPVPVPVVAPASASASAPSAGAPTETATAASVPSATAAPVPAASQAAASAPVVAPPPVTAQTDLSPSHPAALTTTEGSAPVAISDAQGSVLGMVMRLAATVERVNRDNARLTKRLDGFDHVLKSDMDDVERRLLLAEANQTVTRAERGDPDAASTPMPPATRRRDAAPAMTVAVEDQPATVPAPQPPVYRIQGASPDLAILSSTNPQTGESGSLMVKVGNDVPGYGRVTGIVERGNGWAVNTTHGVIR